MDAFLQQFQHLNIQLEEIISATNNFNDRSNRIGVGGFGNVYKGEVSHFKGRSMVAIKRLDPKRGQGIPEFLKEITMISSYRHKNIISLMEFCYEGREMILAYELASRGSLDRHLNSPHLSWTQRLKICLDAAKGLAYLHDPREKHQRLIHCDIKSGNILLDDHWTAKVSDFGLSIMGPANEQHSVVVTLAAGTEGYIDPQYRMTHTLKKESDVYSFGVVLFEVLYGRLCCIYKNGHVENNFVPMWKESYKQKRLNDIIFKSPTIQPLDQSALETFSDVASLCLKESREDRPTMIEVVTELETALESQEFSEWNPPFDYEEMTKTAEPPLTYSSRGELRKHLSKGVFLNNGKTRFSLNKKGEHCELTYFTECLDLVSNVLEGDKWVTRHKSRIAYMCTYPFKDGNVKIRVIAQFLSPGTTYTVNLVFQFINDSDFYDNNYYTCEDDAGIFRLISLKYKLQGEAKSSVSYLAYKREDGWWMCELYQFTSDHNIIDLEILFEGFNGRRTDYIDAGGIEFWPLEKVEHKVPEDENLDTQPISDSDAKWEEKLPADYEHIIEWSEIEENCQVVTKKEAYSILCKGLFMFYGEMWFYLDKNGKKCHMLPARGLEIRPKPNYTDTLSSPTTRFGEVAQCGSRSVRIDMEIESQLVSSETPYASYLVYTILKDQSAPIIVEDGLKRDRFIYIVSPQMPVIGPKADQNTHYPVNRPKIKGLPHQREDGWMEVQISEFQTGTTTDLSILLTDYGEDLSGLIIEGVEFRPI